MLVLGVHGGNKFEYEDDLEGFAWHDGAAVLLKDGEIVAAIEEERLNRIKHSNCFPVRSIAFCLKTAGVSLQQLDAIAINSAEYHADWSAKNLRVEYPDSQTLPNGRSQIAARFQRAFGVDVSDKLYFCNHHLAHAASAFFCSGFQRSLILSLDGFGDGSSGMVLVGQGRKLTKLREFSVQQSLGRLYSNIIRLIGYNRFDEYKAMGLAPYGNPATFGELFQQCYALLPNGDFRLEPFPKWLEVLDGAGLIAKARRKGEPFRQEHQDLAAALQQTTEIIAMHVLRYYREFTGETLLSMAGGVAHNCTLNGKILYSGLFEKVFVQPAAHDAGGALGAAICAFYDKGRNTRPAMFQNLYLGTGIGSSAEIKETLDCWSGLISYAPHPDVASAAARLIADGAVIGWAQGKSEFGPRALGNRSILADPRPASNKLRINEMVKKREQYRPFAPSVLQERISEFFETPATQTEFPHMIFVLKVCEAARNILGAVTHIDSTARVQSVSRHDNPLYWQLIAEFDKITGVPVLLNTSFNNHAEPIVDSSDDAIASFLSTEIQVLVIGDYIVTKKPQEERRRGLRDLAIKLMPSRKLVMRYAADSSPERWTAVYVIENTKSRHFGKPSRNISAEVFKILQSTDGSRTIGEIIEQQSISPNRIGQITDELVELWVERIISVSPGWKNLTCFPRPREARHQTLHSDGAVASALRR